MARSNGCPLAAWRHRRAASDVDRVGSPGAPSPDRTDQQVLGDLAHLVLKGVVGAGWPDPAWEAQWDAVWSECWESTKPRATSRLSELPNVYVVQHGLRRWLLEAADRGIAVQGAWAEEAVEIGDHPVAGRIDLLTRDDEGHYGVWDLKTGAPPRWGDGAPEQLSLYAAIVAESRGPVATVGIIGRVESTEWQYVAGMAAVLDRYRDAAAAMASPDPPDARVDESACVRCPWLDTCYPAHKWLFGGGPTGKVHAAHDHPSGQYLTLHGPQGDRWQTPALFQPNGLPAVGCEVDVLDVDGTARAVARTE